VPGRTNISSGHRPTPPNSVRPHARKQQSGTNPFPAPGADAGRLLRTSPVRGAGFKSRRITRPWGVWHESEEYGLLGIDNTLNLRFTRPAAAYVLSVVCASARGWPYERPRRRTSADAAPLSSMGWSARIRLRGGFLTDPPGCCIFPGKRPWATLSKNRVATSSILANGACISGSLSNNKKRKKKNELKNPGEEVKNEIYILRISPIPAPRWRMCHSSFLRHVAGLFPRKMQHPGSSQEFHRTVIRALHHLRRGCKLADVARGRHQPTR